LPENDSSLPIRALVVATKFRKALINPSICEIAIGN
jgi:hypothetical protein